MIKNCFNTYLSHKITCDGSIDCANNPASQEEILYYLHYSEVVTALSMLTIGGCLVLKVFTLFESSSVALAYLVACHFESVSSYLNI